MTNQQILKKAILKAVKNGWNNKLWSVDLIRYKKYNCYCFIFSHDFAKSFWGEKSTEIEFPAGRIIIDELPIWKHHLQMMVLEPEPLKYLNKFLT